MLKVRPAKFYRVVNNDKKSAASKHYNMIVTENRDGDITELLFTDSDLAKALVRTSKNREDIPSYVIVSSDNGGFVYAVGLLLTSLVGGLVGYFLSGANLW